MTHWILFVINISDEYVYVLNLMNHDVNGFAHSEFTKYISYFIFSNKIQIIYKTNLY
jgi:hypothetical protein